MRPRILEERPRGRFSIRSRGRRRRPELEVRRVDRRADRDERLALGLHAHHVTRDVHAERSGGGVTRELNPPRLLRLDVAGAVRGVTQALATAGARHPRERVRVFDGEAIEPRYLFLRGKDRQPAVRERLDLVADRGHRDGLGTRGCVPSFRTALNPSSLRSKRMTTKGASATSTGIRTRVWMK